MAAEPMARIWLTYKTRMISEERYNKYAIVSHLALTWYAFLSIVFSIYQDTIAKTLGAAGASQASLVISVLTFGLSLVIYGFKFEDSARIHRDCYLRMQIIYQSSQTDQAKLDEYRKLLEHFPNHAPRDYQMVLFNAWKGGRFLSSTDGSPIRFSRTDAAAVYFRKFITWLILGLVFKVPFILLIYWMIAV